MRKRPSASVVGPLPVRMSAIEFLPMPDVNTLTFGTGAPLNMLTTRPVSDAHGDSVRSSLAAPAGTSTVPCAVPVSASTLHLYEPGARCSGSYDPSSALTGRSTGPAGPRHSIEY